MYGVVLCRGFEMMQPRVDAKVTSEENGPPDRNKNKQIIARGRDGERADDSNDANQREVIKRKW